MNKLLLIAGLISVNASAEQTPVVDDEKQEKTVSEKHIEKIRILGSNDGLRTDTGSATFIGEQELATFEYDDINRVLAKVPGVNIRQEDGYGLRPNIGFRGVTPERSKKIALLEDGILIAPAPYSAAAAYYFPQVNRLVGVEVFKGPASIKYGPNTVAGALNLITRPIPEDSEGALDLAIGSDGYKKHHLHYGNKNGRFGYLFEALNLSADGFKELDGGGDTGFNKNSFMAKFNYDLSSDDIDQLIEIKLEHDNERSNESYLGLTEEDFELTPNRRYAASSDDVIKWNHSNVLISHFVEAQDSTLTTRAYYNKFARSWNKLNGFGSDESFNSVVAIEDVIANPNNGSNADFLEVLRGDRNSETVDENLVLGDNDREYYAWGIQSDFTTNLDLAGLTHELEVGIRYHEDEIERFHTVDFFSITDGELAKLTDNDPVQTTFNTELSKAYSIYIQDSVTVDALTLTVGLRGEFIDSSFQNTFNDNDFLNKKSRIWLPGFSGFYTVNEELGFLFGVNKGYVPTGPIQDPRVKSEESINYELGSRYNNGTTQADFVLFYNDFSNLTETCTFSTSSICNDINVQFNAGKVDIYGIEANINHTIALTDNIDMPLSAVYTYSRSEFKESFDSSFPLWGSITAGDEVPYLPKNQLTLTMELVSNDWQVALLGKYIGKMKEASGTGVNYEGVSTNSLTVFDFSSNYNIGNNGSVYFKVDNIFEAVESVSRRPFGARPSKPRQATLGYKLSF